MAGADVAAKARKKAASKAPKQAPAETTRQRILRCAWEIIDSEGGEAATMKAVAQAAGVSRQAVYLHFADRTELLLALNDYLEAEAGLEHWVQEIEAEPDGRTRLQQFLEIRHLRMSRLRALVSSVESARYSDETAAAAARRRYNLNVKWFTDLIIRKLDEERLVHPTWNHKDAASVIVLLFSFHAWDDLVHIARFNPEKYAETLMAVTLSILAGPAKALDLGKRGTRRWPELTAPNGAKRSMRNHRQRGNP